MNILFKEPPVLKDLLSAILGENVDGVTPVYNVPVIYNWIGELFYSITILKPLSTGRSEPKGFAITAYELANKAKKWMHSLGYKTQTDSFDIVIFENEECEKHFLEFVTRISKFGSKNPEFESKNNKREYETVLEAAQWVFEKKKKV